MQALSDHSLGPFLTNAYGNRFLYPVNRDTFRSIDARSRFHQLFGEGLRTEKTLHILVGTDSGMLLDYLRDAKLPEASRFLFVELPAVVNRLNNEGLLDNLHERVACISIDQMPRAAEQFQFQNYLYTEKINIWKSFAALDAFLPEYAELYGQTRDFIDTYAWKIKIQLGNKNFITRQLENLADNRHSATCLKNLFTGKTAVLLAGGPSLDNILPWVKEYRKKLIVLAVSRIARRLKEVDLTPDIFFSVDPLEVSFEVSKEMLYFGDRTLLVNSFHVVPKLLSQWQGRSVFVGPRWPWPDDIDEEYMNAPGPTVTNTAFATAVEMGFNQIVLAGVDLCFSQSGYSHAQGSYERQAGPKFTAFPIQVQTNQGTKAFTTRPMAEAITTFGNLVAHAQRLGCHTINPSPTSAVIPQVEYRSLNDLALGTMSEPAWQTIEAALPPDGRASRITYYEQLEKKLRKAKKHIRKIQKLSREAIQCNKGLFGRDGRPADFKNKIRMDKIEDTLQKPPLARFSALLKEAELRQFVKIVRPDMDQEWSDEQIEETARLYYQAYCDSANETLKQLTLAMQRIELRLVEEKLETDPSLLLDAWQHFGEPGRARLWRQQHQALAQTWSVATVTRFEEFDIRFQDILTQQAEQVLKTKGSADPESARHGVRVLFKNRDQTALSDLLEGMAESSQDNMKPVFHLTCGYLAELENDFPKAMEEYRQVLELSQAKTSEEALRRIASLSLQLQDHENALLALKCLTGLSPQYLSQYADLARMLGQIKTSLDAYADYLEYFPDDPEVLVKVGKLYQQAGEPDFAVTIFNHLLLKDPGNQAARSLLDDLNRSNPA